jgi:hypothetical protein
METEIEVAIIENSTVKKNNTPGFRDKKILIKKATPVQINAILYFSEISIPPFCYLKIKQITTNLFLSSQIYVF